MKRDPIVKIKDFKFKVPSGAKHIWKVMLSLVKDCAIIFLVTIHGMVICYFNRHSGNILVEYTMAMITIICILNIVVRHSVYSFVETINFFKPDRRNEKRDINYSLVEIIADGKLSYSNTKNTSDSGSVCINTIEELRENQYIKMQMEEDSWRDYIVARYDSIKQEAGIILLQNPLGLHYQPSQAS